MHLGMGTGAESLDRTVPRRLQTKSQEHLGTECPCTGVREARALGGQGQRATSQPPVFPRECSSLGPQGNVLASFHVARQGPREGHELWGRRAWVLWPLVLCLSFVFWKMGLMMSVLSSFS